MRANQMHGLEWRQPAAFSRQYELKSGDAVLGELRFLKTFGTLARAVTADGAWTFKRAGFLTPVVTARVEGSETDMASYLPRSLSQNGTMTLAGGEALEFKATNFWASEWVLFDAQRREVLRFHNKGVLHHGASVEPGAGAAGRTDVGVLAALCWYILVLYMEDSSAVMVATTAVT
jgi:hypothetical protein